MYHVMIMVSMIKGAELRTLKKYLCKRNRFWLFTPNSRSDQSSLEEVKEIVVVILEYNFTYYLF